MMCCECKYSDRPVYADPCVECEDQSKFEKKEDVKMSKVTIEYEEVKRPIKTIKAKSLVGNESYFTVLCEELMVDFIDCRRSYDKETAIELVAALNELVKQL